MSARCPPETSNEFRLTALALAEALIDEEPDFDSIIDLMNALNEAQLGQVADFSSAERLVFLCVQLTGLATCASSPAFQVTSDDIALGEEIAAGIKRIFARLIGLEDADVEVYVATTFDSWPQHVLEKINAGYAAAITGDEPWLSATFLGGPASFLIARVSEASGDTAEERLRDAIYSWKNVFGFGSIRLFAGLYALHLARESNDRTLYRKAAGHLTLSTFDRSALGAIARRVWRGDALEGTGERVAAIAEWQAAVSVDGPKLNNWEEVGRHYYELARQRLGETVAGRPLGDRRAAERAAGSSPPRAPSATSTRSAVPSRPPGHQAVRRCPQCGDIEHPSHGACPEWQKAHGELSRIGDGVDDVRQSVEELAEIAEKGFEELTEETRKGFEKVDKGLASVKQAVGYLESSVGWGFQMLTTQLAEAVGSLQDIASAVRDPDWARGQALLSHGVATLLRAEPEYVPQVAQAAQTLFERAKDLMPTEWWPRSCLGISLLLQLQFDGAENELREGRAFAVGDPILALSSYRLLAWVRFCRGDLGGALNESNRALAHGDDALVHYDLACYYALSGRGDEAREHLEMAIRARPVLFAMAEKEEVFDGI